MEEVDAATAPEVTFAVAVVQRVGFVAAVTVVQQGELAAITNVIA